MVDRLDNAFRFYQQAIALRAQRQEVLSANIANADTPGYKARDFDFSSALREAVGTGSVPRLPEVRLSLTSAAHIPAAAQGSAGAQLLYRQPLQPSLDGNTVDMDAERVAFADNTLRYQSTATLVSSRIKSMLAAVQQ
ncbi:flagellar basal body rod protein FlgB [Verticiella sediminum]|uniref:Flagellar basal body rod protein FlgB n=1 Tax=Verticiella sediminum TaxID=1247510 RepID=A0A556ARX0_9BURK|nr:flagellar basal body rod protein FlgB [Verticiella sediminum]TSH95682.1 flagellar basal body rod protein FlgB [Verticiella sediminum]